MHSRALPFFLPKWRLWTPALWAGFAIWVALLAYESNRPGLPVLVEQPVLHWDKLQHLTFFFFGAISLGAALRATFPMRWGTLFLVVILTLSALGLADEIHQLFVTNRSGGDPFDWMADLIGSACGLAVLRRFYAKRPRENSGTPQRD